MSSRESNTHSVKDVQVHSNLVTTQQRYFTLPHTYSGGNRPKKACRTVRGWWVAGANPGAQVPTCKFDVFTPSVCNDQLSAASSPTVPGVSPTQVSLLEHLTRAGPSCRRFFYPRTFASLVYATSSTLPPHLHPRNMSCHADLPSCDFGPRQEHLHQKGTQRAKGFLQNVRLFQSNRDWP